MKSKKNKPFSHCLRVQIYPAANEDERIADVVNHCLKFGFNNVMLFINAEEYNVGHMTIEEAKPWIKTMKKTKRALEAVGVSVSLNPWMELGHLDRCRPLKDGQNFTTQVDYDGSACTTVACPLCEEWKKYFFEFYKYIVSELEPDTVWVEDDFRLHNHGDLKFGGCFCALHMRKYNEKLGTNYSREEFTDRLFRKNPEKRAKKAWLDVNRECMTALARELGEVVASLGLKTKVGLMSSAHDYHALEGRDWSGVQRGLAAGGELIDRLHLPCYHELSGKNYFYEFNRLPFLCRALLPKETTVYPELENGSFSTFTKCATFLRFQLESAIPLCIDGMTYDIYDFVGNGACENFGYGEAVKEITPYLNGVGRLGLSFDELDGVILPVCERTAYNRDVKATCFESLRPDESFFSAYITSLGIATEPSKKKRFRGKTVALGCGNAYNFTDDELRSLFRDNRVILDGGAARILVDRGLGGLIGALGYETFVAEKNVHSYEEIADGLTVNGKTRYRASAFGKAGDYVKIDYASEGGAKSFVFDYLGNEVGVGIMDGGNYYVVPYVVDGKYYEQFNDLRVTFIREFAARGERYLSTDRAGGCAYLYRKGGKTAVIVVNSTEDDLPFIDLTVSGYAANEARFVDKKSGKLKAVELEKTDKGIRALTPLAHLSTATLILK